MADLKLTLDESTGNYDVSFVNGDFVLTEGFDTSIVVSLFSDARADESEVSRPELRRGWWGDETVVNKIRKLGSKLWLLSQARLTSDTLNRSKNYAFLALKWLVDEGYSKKIESESSFDKNGALQIHIEIVNGSGATESKSYKVWQQTYLG